MCIYIYVSCDSGVEMVMQNISVCCVPKSAHPFSACSYSCLTLALLTLTIWRAPTNASKWRMGFNSAFKGLKAL